MCTQLIRISSGGNLLECDNVVKIPVLGFWSLRTFGSRTPSNTAAHWELETLNRQRTKRRY